MSDRATELLSLARTTLAESFGAPKVDRPDPWPDERRAVFVTLTKAGELRGCVGQVEPRYPLGEAVREAARSAAFHDRRFPPLEANELGELHLEVSVLSPIEWREVSSEEEVLEAVRPGHHGVVLRHDGRSGLFLPQMWEQLPDPAEFFFHLRRKAGLPTDRWLPRTQLGLFTAEVFEER